MLEGWQTSFEEPEKTVQKVLLLRIVSADFEPVNIPVPSNKP